MRDVGPGQPSTADRLRQSAFHHVDERGNPVELPPRCGAILGRSRPCLLGGREVPKRQVSPDQEFVEPARPRLGTTLRLRLCRFEMPQNVFEDSPMKLVDATEIGDDVVSPLHTRQLDESFERRAQSHPRLAWASIRQSAPPTPRGGRVLGDGVEAAYPSLARRLQTRSPRPRSGADPGARRGVREYSRPHEHQRGRPSHALSMPKILHAEGGSGSTRHNDALCRADSPADCASPWVALIFEPTGGMAPALIGPMAMSEVQSYSHGPMAPAEPRTLEPRSSVVTGSLWMVGITLALFFFPLVNGLVGGLVGGYKVGGVRRALTAAILPAIVAAAGLWVIFAILDAVVLGFVAGLAAGVVIALADVGIFIGAAIGGAVRNRRS